MRYFFEEWIKNSTFQCGVLEHKSPFHTLETHSMHAIWLVNFKFSVLRAVIIGDWDPKCVTFVVRSSCVRSLFLIWQRFTSWEAKDVNSLLSKKKNTSYIHVYKRIINHILTMDHYSDFRSDQTFAQFNNPDTELELHRITNSFHWTFATCLASQRGTLTFPDTWFRPPFWVLLIL